MGDDIAIFVSDEKVMSGLASESVEYQAWIADGNTAEEWKPDAITEPTVEPETTQPDMEEGN
jgi:hypothetical protein